jgi:hypothetical protein
MLGASEGGRARELCEAGFRGEIVATDIADKALDGARRSLAGYDNVTYVLADLDHDRFAGQFDFIVAEGVLDLDNIRRREWAVAVKASGVATPARIYDLRATFASNALAAGVTVFELVRVMGTSVRMIDCHYGALLDGARTVIANFLDAFETELEKAVGE